MTTDDDHTPGRAGSRRSRDDGFVSVGDARVTVPALTDEGELLWLVGYLYRASRQRIEQLVRLHGVTIAQMSILMALADQPGLTGIEVADRAFVTPQAAHAALSALERKGLLQRTSGAARRRVVHSELTDEGARVLTDCLADLQVVGSELAVGLDEQQRSDVLDLMRLWVANGHQRPGFDARY